MNKPFGVPMWQSSLYGIVGTILGVSIGLLGVLIYVY